MSRRFPASGVLLWGMATIALAAEPPVREQFAYAIPLFVPEASPVVTLALPTPVYREVERSGPHHDPQFRVAVDLPGLAPAEGVGGSKRAAEKVAASVMIAREGVGGSHNDG